jgi:ABC-type branched-subunit amino acid transport system substrate-binding protein
VRLLLCVALLLASAANASPLSPGEARGKQLYTTGISAAGREVNAYVGSQSVLLPASAVPCNSCHGPDGLGRPEAGVIPTDIRWRTLSKPYGAVASGARQHPPYTAESFEQALRAGIDPGGNPLVTAMPRYELAPEDLADLIAYLQRIDTELDPGVTDKEIVIGTVLPDTGPMAGVGAAMRAVMDVYFTDINAGGGIYGRELRLEVASGETGAALLASGRALLSEETRQPFALLATYTGGRDAELGQALDQHGVPLLGTFTRDSAAEAATLHSVFYLFGGLAVQSQALVDHAADTLKPSRVAILAQASKHDGLAVSRFPFLHNRIDAPGIAQGLEDRGVQTVFFLGSGSQFQLLTEAAYRLDWEPYMYLLGSLTGNYVFKAPLDFQDRVFMAFPTSANDRTPAGVREFNDFHRRHRLVHEHLPAQISVYTATKTLLFGLRQAGRDLTRAKLISALEGLYQFDTGLTPPLSFGPNRRIGALGAHVVAVDLRKGSLGRSSEWVTPQ